MAVIKYKCGYSGLSGASSKARRIKNKLQNCGWYDIPMLKIHPKAKNWENFGNLITSPYVKQEEVGNADFNHYIFFANGGGTTPSNLDRYFKPLDIAKIREIHKVSGITYYHFGIYLGDVGDGKRICHFTSENDGVRLTDWDGFLKDRIGELYRYHSMIPFKWPRRIAEQIAWAYSTKFREDQYSLVNRNCEHFANMVVYGINYSKQIEDSNLASVNDGWGTFNVGAMSLAFSVLTLKNASVSYIKKNNDKGSTIKLTNEMSESNDRLGEKIEVPSKEYCRIM